LTRLLQNPLDRTDAALRVIALDKMAIRRNNIRLSCLRGHRPRHPAAASAAAGIYRNHEAHP